MKPLVSGLGGAPHGDAGVDRYGVQSDPLAVVAAHRAMSSVAFVAGALSALEQGSAISAEERDQLLSRAVAHTGVIRALLYDLVLGLPLGASAVAATDDPLRKAEQRFGVRAGANDRPVTNGSRRGEAEAALRHP